MEYLPFIDKDIPDKQSQEIVEQLIQDEIRTHNKDNTTQLHPDVYKLTKSLKIDKHVIADSLYEEYLRNNELLVKQGKRPVSTRDIEDAFLENFKTKHPRIDFTRYSMDNLPMDKRSQNDSLAIVDSYLAHQLITLRDLLPKTIVNQWAINNDFLKSSDQTIQDILQSQRKQLVDLDNYREKVQAAQVPAFQTLEYDTNEKILDIIEETFPKKK